MQLPIPPQDFNMEHYYGVFVEVPLMAQCPHGMGATVPAENGVRIACPMDRDCWLVKWRFVQGN